MNLIDRYIYAVIRHLSVDQREDVADELRSMIEDQLDEMGSRSKKHIEEVLISLGDPEVLARKYTGSKQYLIGPVFYPVFIRTLKIAFAIGLPIAFIFQLIAQLGAGPSSLITLLVTTIGTTVAVGIQIAFWVGLVFFILERSGTSAKDMRRYEGVWNPSMLPKLSKKRQIPISDAISDIPFYILLLVLPFVSQFMGIHTETHIIPFFNPDIWSVVAPVVFVFGVVGILKAVFKLMLRNWTRWLAVFNLLFALIFSAAFVLAFLKLDLINPAFLSLFDAHVDTANLEQVTNWTMWTVAITIVITVGSYVFDGIKYIPIAFKIGKYKS